MTKNLGLITLIVIASLLLGGIIAYFAFPQTITKEVVVNKEIIKEVPVVTEVEIEVTPDYKQLVVDELLIEAAKDKSFRKCGGHSYDIEEISVKKVYDGFVLTEDSDGDTAISDVKVKLNYDDGDCYATLTCGLDSDNDLNC